jgi:microsomal epoxide hydrolase
MDRDPTPLSPSRRAHAHDFALPRVRPFHVRVDPAVLEDLQHRLERVRWSEPSGGWERGTSRPYLRALVHHWRDAYHGRAYEARLGALPQLVADIDGAELHFAYVRTRDPQSAPLLLLHGWPGSFYTFHKAIPLLSAACDVIVPSLPGFAFSRDPQPRDPPMQRTATLLWRLMTDVLGYTRFGVVGGDIGGALAQVLAIEHPEAIVGVHLTDLGPRALQVDPASLSRGERRYIDTAQRALAADGAAAHVQATRPRSVEVELADSPVGLASWIVDRFHAGCGDLARLSQDDLLAHIMLYWTTQTIGSSFRLRAAADSPARRDSARVTRPVGLALFPHDLAGIPPRSLAERTLAVAHWTEMPRGGRFAALEEPDLFARDVIEFFASLSEGRGR